MVRKGHLWLMVISITVTLLFSAVPRAYSQGTGSGFQAFDLGEVVVSADATKVNNIAITNEITADDIKATNSHTVAEALSHAPGVRVTTGAKNQATVSIHGFDQSRILFLIDGVPYYETKFGILDLSSISSDNIAKIEIIKGAPSVLYGANAMGGVVNIITKKPTDKPFTSASFELSENDTYRFSASHGQKIGIFNYWLNYMYEKSNGWDLSNDYEPKAGTLTNRNVYPYRGRDARVTHPVFEDGEVRDNSDYKTQSVGGRFGIERNKDSGYYMTLFYREKDKGVPSNTVSNNVFAPPVFSQFYADRIPDYNEWGIDLDARQRLTDQLMVKGKLFYHNHKDSLYSYEDPTFDDVLAKSHYKDYFVGGSLMAEYQPVSWDTVRLAFNYKKDSHKEIADSYLPYEKYVSYTGSVGLENEFTWIKDLSVIAGISYDWFKVTEARKNVTSTTPGRTYGDYLGQDDAFQPDDDQVNPMIGAHYTFLDKTKVFTSAARKTRFPTLNNLYNNIAYGDPHLKSEVSKNYTVGVSRPFGSFLSTDFSLFWHDIKDRISVTGTGADKHSINVGKVRMVGYEAGVEIYPVEKMILRADYTYIDAEDRTEDRVTNDVTDVPTHNIHLSAQYTLPVIGTRIDLNGSYLSSVFTNVTPGSRNRVGSYFLADAKFTQEFAKYFEVYVAANNLLDEDYEWGDGYPAQGRSFWSGLSVKF